MRPLVSPASGRLPTRPHVARSPSLVSRNSLISPRFRSRRSLTVRSSRPVAGPRWRRHARVGRDLVPGRLGQQGRRQRCLLCLVRDRYIGLDEPPNDRLHRWQVPAVAASVPQVTLGQVLRAPLVLPFTRSLVTAVIGLYRHSSRCSLVPRRRRAPRSLSS